jgi:signal peptidase
VDIQKLSDMGREAANSGNENASNGNKNNNDSKERKDSMLMFFKDIIISLVIVAIVIASIWGYTRSWPPMVVIESGSMSHSPESIVGVIDAGDLVLVKSIDSRSDIITYVEGEQSDHETYGEWGDVIVYYKNGYTGQIPVIHRALVWLEYNETSGGYDVPTMSLYNIHTSFRMENIGYNYMAFDIDVAGIITNFNNSGLQPHSGFITLGDHNHGSYDQGGWMGDGLGQPVLPVKPEWVIGKARGELPWFGGIKLYLTDKDEDDGVGWEAVPDNSKSDLIIALVVIIAIPIVLDILTYVFVEEKERKKGKERDEGEDEGGEDIEESGESEEPSTDEALDDEKNTATDSVEDILDTDEANDTGKSLDPVDENGNAEDGDSTN